MQVFKRSYGLKIKTLILIPFVFTGGNFFVRAKSEAWNKFRNHIMAGVIVHNGLQLPEGGGLEHYTVYTHKCFFETQMFVFALSRHFWVGAVTSCPSVCRSCSVHCLSYRCALAWWLFCNFWSVCWLVRIANVPPNGLVLTSRLG